MHKLRFNSLPPLLSATLLGIGLWSIFTLANTDGLLIGLAFTVLAIGLSLRFYPRDKPNQAEIARINVVALFRLGFFFLHNSFLGAINIASLVFNPGKRLQPQIFTYQFKYPGSRMNVLMAYLQNLLPGTLCTKLNPQDMNVHVLQDVDQNRADLQTLEALILRCRQNPTNDNHTDQSNISL